MKTTPIPPSNQRRALRAALLVALGVAASVFAAVPAAEAQRYGLVAQWGKSGSGNGEFADFRLNLATDHLGNVYVVDGSSHFDRIQKFTSNGRFVTMWDSGRDSRGNRRLGGWTPTEVATDRAGNVYVAGRGHPYFLGGVVAKYTSGGTLLAEWYEWSRAFLGPFDDRPHTPQALDTDAAGNVYIANDVDPFIVKLNPNGRILTAWGSRGSGDGQFIAPDGLATDRAGDVYVSDRSNHTVQKFSANGRFITRWGGFGRGDGQFENPRGVATDGSNNVFVVDGYHTIQKFASSGRFLTRWGRAPDVSPPPPPPPPPPVPRSRRARSPYVVGPTDAATDAAGNVYIADVGHSVRKFGPAPTRPGIRKGPKRRTRKRSAVFTFHFHSQTPGVRFQCRLTGQRVPRTLRRWRRCRSPKRYRNLRPGTKTFWVRGIGRAGLVGEPDTKRWRIVPGKSRRR
ncbi:MAG TPA: hypothetical protein VEX39_07455 [Thermoleophilaceae bacterium]|nr:hypothetical protein [Thermoleophilaceae bacterium]